jgi:hypothetical protein
LFCLPVLPACFACLWVHQIAMCAIFVAGLALLLDPVNVELAKTALGL